MSDKKLSAWQKYVKKFAKDHKNERFPGKGGFLQAAAGEYKAKAKAPKKPRGPLSAAQKKKMASGRRAAKLQRNKDCGKDILQKCTVEMLKKKVRRLNKKIKAAGGKEIKLGQDKAGLIKSLHKNRQYALPRFR